MNGLYFSDDSEPIEFYYNLMKDLEEIWDREGIKYVHLKYDNADDFYAALHAMNKYASENITAYGTSRTDQYEIILNEDSDMDDHSAPSTIALQKKRKKPGSKTEEAKEEENEKE